jgi:hypothetical protein
MSTAQRSPLKLDFLAKELEPQLEPLAKQVVAQFELPPLRLYCYFAQNDDPYLRQRYGKHFRGFHAPIEGRNELPEYLADCFFHPFDPFSSEQMTWEKMVAYDNLIYVTHRTTLDPTAFVVTLAHELQHFMQFAYAKPLWVVNSILYGNIKSFDPFTPRTPIDIPHEREANIVSERVAEGIVGEDAIKTFAEEQVKHFAALADQGDESAASEKTRWVFFRDVPSSLKFDLLAETIPLVESFKPQLIAKGFGIEEGIDFRETEWWL